MKKGLSITAIIVLFAISAAIFEPRQAVSAYCAGVIFDVEDGENICAFVIAAIENPDIGITVDILKYKGGFAEGLNSMEGSDIRLFMPTSLAVLVSTDFPQYDLECNMTEMLAEKSMPPSASVIFCDSPQELSSERDIATDIVGVVFLPKLLKNQKQNQTLVDFHSGNKKTAPYIFFEEGRFIIDGEYSLNFNNYLKESKVGEQNNA